MRKTRSDANWNKLSPKQLATLNKWLFEERISYTAAFALAQAKLNFKGSLASLKRYGRRTKDEQVFENFEDLRYDLAALSKAPADPKAIHSGATKLMGSFLFKRLQESPDDVPKWAPVANLLMQNNYTEMLREAKAREHGIRQQALSFAKKKFQFETMEKALRALPQLRDLAEARKDPQTKRAEHQERIEEIREMMFGNDEGEVDIQAPGAQSPDNDQASND